MSVVDESLELVKSGKFLPENNLRNVCDIVKAILVEESNVQPVSSPVIICGDIHGQFYDLLELFRTGGGIDQSKYIFLGDFVDRGNHSVETLQFLFCLKAKYPDRITLLRGNHESRQITKIYGFYSECINKYGSPSPWKLCTDVFDYLLLGAIVDNSVLCVHGGLSPDLNTIDQVRTIDRVREVPQNGPFCDLMWSDPEDVEKWTLSPRGSGYLFGARVVREFQHINKLELIARSHQLVQEGFKYHFPENSVVTVWSAPNYCHRCGNIAAILCLDHNMQREFRVFTEAERKDDDYDGIKPSYFL